MERGWKWAVVALAIWVAVGNSFNSRWAAAIEADLDHLLCWEHTTRFHPERQGNAPTTEWSKCMEEARELRRKKVLP